MTPLRLHGYFNSSAAYRVRIALALKCLAWEPVDVNLRDGEQRGERYTAINAAQMVPALEHDGRIITQSLAIIDYLDALEAQPRLVPADPDLRARALEQACLIGCDIHPLDNLRVLTYLRNELGHGEEPVSQWYAHWIRRGFDALEQLLPEQGEGFCLGTAGGAAPSIADCFLVPQVSNAERFAVDLGPWPRIRQVAACCRALPAFESAAPRHQPDFVERPAGRA